MNTLAEIEAAAAALPPKQQRQLLERLTARLDGVQVSARSAKAARVKTADPLAGMKAHWRRIQALTGGEPVLNRRAQARFDRALRGE
ncbi:MAG: hypothetical protein WDN28_18365 [Chthoniobacter sp.]